MMRPEEIGMPAGWPHWVIREVKDFFLDPALNAIAILRSRRAATS